MALNLGIVLRGWRERSGLTLREAGEVIGISHSTLYRVEAGESATDANTFMAILAWLIRESDADKPAKT